MTDPISECINYQRQLFELLLEFFIRCTGVTPNQFGTFETFPSEIRSMAHHVASRSQDAFIWAEENIRPFYSNNIGAALQNAASLSGLKLVQGGGSRFGKTQFDSARGSLLYGDTVLIPDPVLPWFEVNREEEQFQHVILIQMVFGLLHLKPIVDADLPVPAVFVFPSMEKLLEGNDYQTQETSLQLLIDLIAHFVDPAVSDFQDVSDYIQSNPQHFLAQVENNNLLVAPGGIVGEPLQDALANYDKEVRQWRTAEWINEYEKWSLEFQVFNAIAERVQPQFHLLENASCLNAHPLCAVIQQSHYFRLISEVNTARLVNLQLLDSKRQALVKGMCNERLTWLNSVPIDILVGLRMNNENATFRNRLLTIVTSMHDAQIQDVNILTDELSLEIGNITREHENHIREIQEKYSRAHGNTAVASWATLGAMLMPSLAPFIGVTAPVVVAAKYALDKTGERREINQASRSLMGVIAKAQP